MIDIGEKLLKEHFYEYFFYAYWNYLMLKKCRDTTPPKKKCTKIKYLKDHTGYQSYQLLFESLYYSIYHVVNNVFYDSI